MKLLSQKIAALLAVRREKAKNSHDRGTKLVSYTTGIHNTVIIIIIIHRLSLLLGRWSTLISKNCNTNAFTWEGLHTQAFTREGLHT